MFQIWIRAPLLMATVIGLLTSPVLARDEIRTVPVHFEAGSSSATVKGQIKGYEALDYVLEASEGQRMNVSMATDNLSSYFNILAPGENEAAIFVGSTSGNQFEGALPKSGAYKIRVYMMRSAARRKEVTNYRLEMTVTGAAQKASSPAKSMPSKDEH